MIIKADNLRKFYGEFEALRGINLDLSKGKTGLLGPNGAGKTTFIKVMLGLLEYEEGDVKVFDGHVSGNEYSIRSRIGYMPEKDTFIPDMNGIQFVTYMGELSGMLPSDAMQRAHEVLHYVGLGEERYRAIEEYSTGMKQRAKFAQALVHDPELLILDEPTSGMDPAGRQEMLKLINDVAAIGGKSIILCSHLLEDVEKVCDNVVIMGRGSVLATGALKELMKREHNSISITARGDLDSFRVSLEKAGIKATIIGRDRISAPLSSDEEYMSLIKSAFSTGVELRRIEEDFMTLDEVYMQYVKRQDDDYNAGGEDS